MESHFDVFRISRDYVENCLWQLCFLLPHCLFIDDHFDVNCCCAVNIPSFCLRLFSIKLCNLCSTIKSDLRTEKTNVYGQTELTLNSFTFPLHQHPISSEKTMQKVVEIYRLLFHISIKWKKPKNIWLETDHDELAINRKIRHQLDFWC